MLTVSVHGIRIIAPVGLYKEEHILGNEFEVDVDVSVHVTNANPWPFVDYSLIKDIVTRGFEQPTELVETCVQQLHAELKKNIPSAEKIKVIVRKFHPPFPGDVKYAQVCYEA